MHTKQQEFLDELLDYAVNIDMLNSRAKSIAKYIVNNRRTEDVTEEALELQEISDTLKRTEKEFKERIKERYTPC